jgi:ribosomal subunit interface protein
MPFRVSGRNIDVGEALRTRVSDRVAEAMAKYFDGGYSGHVAIGKDGFGFLTECSIHLDSGITLQAQGMAADAYASADQAALRIEKRLRRYKRRLKGHIPVAVEGGRVAGLEAQSYIIAAPDQDVEEEAGGFEPVVVAETTTPLERLSVSDAVTELDMTGAPVVVFRHAVHGRVNVVYRRPDGHIGWIDPPGAETG